MHARVLLKRSTAQRSRSFSGAKIARLENLIFRGENARRRRCSKVGRKKSRGRREEAEQKEDNVRAHCREAETAARALFV